VPSVPPGQVGCTSQEVPAVQPEAQTPLAQLVVEEQVTHVAPAVPVPQAPLFMPAVLTQMPVAPPSQQPSGQVVALHSTQSPALQKPVTPPKVQAPPSARFVPPQTPLVQVATLHGLQAAQAAPAVPQVPAVWLA